MRLLLAGGGTGGHLFPAVALAEQLRMEDPESEILFVGTDRGLEYRMLPELGWSLRTVDMSGFAGLGLAARGKALVKLAGSFMQSRQILKEFKPDVVVGVGSYASVPVLLAANSLRLPTVIHEQNAWPGLANRCLGRWARRICLSFAAADRAFHHGATTLTGNPVRKAMEACPDITFEKPCLLVFGGSHGSRAINQALIAATPLLNGWRDRLRIVHQTGEQDYEEVSQAYADQGWPDRNVESFIRDMASTYAAATLVVCRAGATTLAELTACGRPAILIPYPHAAGGHQSSNARALAAKGAALMFEEKDLVPAQLASVINDLLQDRTTLQRMASTAKSMTRPGAAARILAECRAVISEVT